MCVFMFIFFLDVRHIMVVTRELLFVPECRAHELPYVELFFDELFCF